MNTPLYLLKDITVPAGTKFEQAPAQTTRVGEGHVSHIIGLSKDTSGELAYFVGEEGSIEREQLKELFSETPPVPTLELDPRAVAKDLYTSYCIAVGGVAFNGDPLPEWREFAADASNDKQSSAWLAAAKTAIALLQPK